MYCEMATRPDPSPVLAVSNLLLVPNNSLRQESRVISSGGPLQSFSEPAQFKANSERGSEKEHKRGGGANTIMYVGKNLRLVQLCGQNKFLRSGLA